MERRKTQAALCAQAIRVILKKEFPGIKFEVHSSNFSMGDSVDVKYIDGPPTKTVEAHIGKFQYGHFDGMTDMYEHTNCRDDIPQTKYLMVSRNLSDETRKRWTDEIRTRYGYPADQDVNFMMKGNGAYFSIANLLWREYQNRDTRSRPHPCSKCQHVQWDLTLMADDSSLCDHCAFLFRQAEKAKEPKKTCKKCKKELGETYRIDTPNDTGSLYYCPECYQEVKKPILSIVR